MNFKILIFVPLVLISGLGIIGMVTGCGLCYDILKWIGIGSFIVAILMGGARLSGFSKVIGLKIPIGEKLSDSKFAVLATLWGFFVFMFAFVWLIIAAFIALTESQYLMKSILDHLKSIKK